MKQFYTLLVTSSFTALVATSAAATDASSVDDLPDSSKVTISGLVDSVTDERTFTLRDDTGKIGVNIASKESVVLKPNDEVRVTGTVDKDLTGVEINASDVRVRKNIARAMGDVIEGNTKLSLEGAKSYDINNLPKEGLVKVSGTVTEVGSEKAFTMQDKTGEIDIDIASPESAAVTKGAKVTVIGYVDQGLISKDINATKVLVVADAKQVSKASQQ